VENPRMELEEHYYRPDHRHLLDLGYKPTHDMETEIEIILQDLLKYRLRIEARAHALTPDIRWDGSRRKVRYLEQAEEEEMLEVRLPKVVAA
jgi:UDP-sulfoquinovose synthase